MIKRSPSLGSPNGPRQFWNPMRIQNVPAILMNMAGYDHETGDMPEYESYNINLNFVLTAGQTLTKSITSRDGTWILLERMANVYVDVRELDLSGLVSVSSEITAEDGVTQVTLIENQPVLLVFGTGEWQTSLFPDTWQVVDNRIFSIKNLSSYNAEVNLGFKLMRIPHRVIY